MVSPLSGGITNHNFKVVLPDRSLVVRVGGAGTEHLGIDRSHEGKTAEIAAKAGISATVLFSDSAAGVLVSEFLDGETLTVESTTTPDVFNRTLVSIRKIHQAPPFPGSFCPFATVRKYHADATNRGVTFPAEVNEALALAARIETALGPNRPQVSCHNDLLPGNFIDDGRRVWIVDWEYAGMGDAFFDLGNFAINLELSDKACGQVIELYFGSASDEKLARLHLMRLASDLREAFWGFLQSAVSKLDFDFREYGQKHLKRFFQNQNGGDFESWLKITNRQ